MYKILLLLMIFSFPACRHSNPLVVIETDAGAMIIELFDKDAPLTVKNFLHYLDEGLYNGSHFYRVVRPDNQPGKKYKIEVIQGGLQLIANIDTFPGIAHENTAATGILHTDGTLSMARDTVGTASTEFFICIGAQPELDYGGKRNPDGQGFAAFGRLVGGMEVVRRIQQLPADSNQFLLKPMRIIRAARLE